jgi:hypothetical protein
MHYSPAPSKYGSVEAENGHVFFVHKLNTTNTNTQSQSFIVWKMFSRKMMF